MSRLVKQINEVISIWYERDEDGGWYVVKVSGHPDKGCKCSEKDDAFTQARKYAYKKIGEENIDQVEYDNVCDGCGNRKRECFCHEVAHAEGLWGY